MKRIDILKKLNTNKHLNVVYLSRNNYYFGSYKKEFSSKDLSFTKNVFTFKELYELLKK
ncbi:MAG: hypothetical protein ACRCZ0_06685 [Cetobacterium sp.]